MELIHFRRHNYTLFIIFILAAILLAHNSYQYVMDSSGLPDVHKKTLAEATLATFNEATKAPGMKNYEEKKTLEEVSLEILKHYQDENDYIPRFSGFLDLQASMWCCVFEKFGMSEIVYVRRVSDGVSRVQVCRFSADELQK